MGKIAEDIAKATQDWKGIPVTVKLTVQNRKAEIEVEKTASALIFRALKEPPRDRKKKNIKHDGNITLDEVYEIARELRFKSQAKHFSGTVKEVLGTALSVGCFVDGKSPKQVQAEIAR